MNMKTLTGKSHQNLRAAMNACLAAALCLFSASALLGQADQGPAPRFQMAPLNPAFVKWLEAQKEREARLALGLAVEPPQTDPASGMRLGYIPDPKWPKTPNAPLTQMEAMVKAGLTTYAPTYDLRSLGFVSPVRNQGSYGTCWAFSSIAALESNMRKSGSYPGDLSEWHLAYFTYNPINGIPSFTQKSVSGHATFDQGGNVDRAIAIMTRGDLAGGPVSAASAPYGNLGALPTGSERSIAKVKYASYTETASVDTIKGLLQEYGVVAISMLIDTDSRYYNDANRAFRMVQTGTSNVNHGVNIVGWDDNFSKDKFPTLNQPSTNGAWIIRNSWGTGWHDAGYFYMSYDTSIFYIGVYIGEAGADAKTYQYDMYGDVTAYGLGPLFWMSNIFTASADHSIKAVGFFTEGDGAGYEISIRKGVGSNPSSGTLALGPQSGTAGAAGYYRIDLNSPVSVGAGEKFAVIVKLTDTDSSYQLPVSMAYSGYTDGATATPGVGWISYNNGSSWNEATSYLSNATVSICVKAFADNDTAVPVDSVSLNKASTALTVGATETLSATVLPTNATNKAVNWSSSNESVATVSSSGLVTAVAAGSATITATSQANSAKSATCAVTVTAIPVESVSLNKTSTTLTVGATETLTATVLPNNASNKSVTWSSSDTSVATVTNAGLVRGVAAGTATITATSAADSTKKATCAVTVTAIPVESVSLNKTSTTLTVGAAETLSATVQPSNATNKNVNWSSSNESVATVSGGRVTAVAVGTATITATSAADSEKKATCAVTVNPVITVSVSPKNSNLQPGGTETFTAIVTGTSNTAVTWTVDGGTITQEGLYTAPSATGTYTIRATSKADTNKYDTATVTVTAVPVVTVSVSPKTVTLNQGATQTFSANVTGTSNHNVTWSVIGQGNITQAGVYTAPAAEGSFTVKATSQADSSKSDTATVTVNPASIVFTNIPKALFVTDTAQLQASAVGLPNTAVTWAVTSGTITQTGFYTAPAAPPSGDGRATITATSQASALSNSVKILIRAVEYARFGTDGNSKTNPQLLDLANAIGSTAPADLAKYDINGDGVINNEDLAMLFRIMGW